MCMDVDVDVVWIASALCYTGSSTTVGLAMTVGRYIATGSPRQLNCHCEANGRRIMIQPKSEAIQPRYP
ncbi:MAG: hypothetical protein FWC76_08345 [Defluviitaleaceae bacterium]|nr:hypothetical protein [Defluviitaleaceae bacterium]